MMKKNIDNIDFKMGRDKIQTSYLTHNFHTYPAKFIPQIPQATIAALTSKGDTVLDPFGGCGTTMVEAKLMGRNGVAVDLNPIGVLVSKAKTTKFDEKTIGELDLLVQQMEIDISRYYRSEKTSVNYLIPIFLNRSHWFEEHVCHELAIIKAHIENIKDAKIKNYLYAAFSSIIVTVSNQESNTRFASISKKIPPSYTLKEFSRKLAAMNKRILEFSKLATDSEIKVFQGDARNLSFLKENSIDHIVTSPPYANTYDYYLYHKFRMLWLGYDVKHVQENEIGSRDKHSSKKQGIETFEKSLDLCLKEMARVLKPNKYVVIVIGDSIIRGNLIKADHLIENIARRNNFKTVRKISYNLKENSKMFNPKFTNDKKKEHIIFFKNVK